MESTSASFKLGIIPPGTELSAHDPDVPVWDTLPADAKRLYARFMEVYAGFVSFTDHHFGRIIEFLKELGELDDTLLVLVSDNGASSEGGPSGSMINARQWNMMPAKGRGRWSPASRRDRRPHDPTTTTPGAGRPRETPRSDAGSVRCTRAASPTRASSTGPRASLTAASAASTPTRSTCSPPCSRGGRHRVAHRENRRGAPAPTRGHELRLHVRPAPDVPEHHDTQYSEMLGSVGDLPPRLEGGLPVADRPTSPRPQEGRRFGTPIPDQVLVDIETHKTGSCTMWTRTIPKPRTWLPSIVTS